MKTFFITGLPRSRTAWLANFLTHGDVSFCFHDGLRFGGPEGLLRKMVEARPASGFVGDSDSALLLFYEQIESLFPLSPWVVIHRPVDEAVRSFMASIPASYYPEVADGARVSRDFDYLSRKMDALERLIDDQRLLRVNYDDLQHERTARSIWDHSWIPHTFPIARWQMLDALRVTMIAEKSMPDAGLLKAAAEIALDYPAAEGHSEAVKTHHANLLPAGVR